MTTLSYQRSQQVQPTSAAAAAELAKERHVLAERYKTKMCRNYQTQGFCPYDVRCMFAHGEHELRSTEMNLADGLITEEAIRSFQRVLRTMGLPVGAPLRRTPPNAQYQQEQAPTGACECEECMQQYRHNPYGYTPVTYPNSQQQQQQEQGYSSGAPQEYCDCEECRAYYESQNAAQYPTVKTDSASTVYP